MSTGSDTPRTRKPVPIGPIAATPAAPPLDGRHLRRAFARAAESFDAADFLQTEIRERLLERLSWTRLEPGRVLDLGAGTGRALPALRERYPAAELIALDVTAPMLHLARDRAPSAWPVCGDAARLPLADASFDCIYSSLVVHWCSSLDAVFAEVRRILRHPGVFSFVTLGPRSFGEMREAWAEVDALPHVMPFPDMRALGDGLVRAGLAEVVMDTETLTIRYRDLAQLVRDLRSTGTTNASGERRRTLTGKQSWMRFKSAYERRRDTEGTLPLTLEVIYGQAWSPAARARPSAAGEATVRFDPRSRRTS